MSAISVIIFSFRWCLWFFAIFWNDFLWIAQIWYDPELGSQIGLDKYINNYFKLLLQCFSYGWTFKSSHGRVYNQSHWGEKRKFSVKALFQLSWQPLKSQGTMVKPTQPQPGSKNFRTLEIILDKKLIPIATLWNKYLSRHDLLALYSL